jgi:hypothetical protein
VLTRMGTRLAYSLSLERHRKLFESRCTDPRLSTVGKWQRALEALGVEFQDESAEHGSGVRPQKGKPAGKRK